MDALIFDFDGVIADSEPIHFDGFAKVLKGIGVELERDDYYEKYLGFDDHDGFAAVMADRSMDCSEERIDELTAQKTKIVQEIIRNSIQALPGAVELIHAAANAGLPIAICSGALREEIELALECIGAGEQFKLIVAARDVAHGKPDPEGYLLAAARLAECTGLDIAPAKCVVIEDSPAGIASGKAAGMKVLAVKTSYPADALIEADAIADTLADVTVDSLRELTE